MSRTWGIQGRIHILCIYNFFPTLFQLNHDLNYHPSSYVMGNIQFEISYLVDHLSFFFRVYICNHQRKGTPGYSSSEFLQPLTQGTCEYWSHLPFLDINHHQSKLHWNMLWARAKVRQRIHLSFTKCTKWILSSTLNIPRWGEKHFFLVDNTNQTDVKMTSRLSLTHRDLNVLFVYTRLLLKRR